MKTESLSLTHLVRPGKEGGNQPPLLILLHGVGSNEHDLFGLSPYLDERFVVVSARAPITLMPGGYGWYHIEFQPGKMIINAEEEASSRKALIGFIDEAVAAYACDPKRVYLMGFSQGSIMSYGLMLSVPQKIAGVVAQSGRLLNEVRPEKIPDGLDGFPIMVTHGVSDNVIPIEYARDAKVYLEGLPVKLTYREYPMAHTISEESLRDVIGWLGDRLNS